MAKLAGLFMLLLLNGAATTSTQAAAAAEQTFYKGKTVRVIVGFAAGGGFDAYARAIARNLGRHIPGNPAIIVENMTGAGSRIAANYLYKASPDGLIIGNFIGSSSSMREDSNGSARRCRMKQCALLLKPAALIP